MTAPLLHHVSTAAAFNSLLGKRRIRDALILFYIVTFAVSMALSFHLLHQIQQEKRQASPNSHHSNNLLFSSHLQQQRYHPDSSNQQTPVQQQNSIIDPIWTCSSSNNTSNTGTHHNNHKLVFVHVFKTAGMTMRELLLRYAVACHKGIGIVSECSGLDTFNNSSSVSSSTTTSASIWHNGFGSKQGQPCWMKALPRSNHDNDNDNNTPMSPQQSSSPQQMDTDTVATKLDVLAGHVPLGVDEWLVPLDNNNHHHYRTTVTYLAFFRHAIDKFVSGIMYQKKDQNYSYPDILELIKKRVKGELHQNKHREGYSAYLLTPTQKQHFYTKKKSTVEERTQQILRNIQEEPILVGIVERMPESLQLLQFVIDSRQEQTPLFEKFGMVTQEAKVHIDDSNNNNPSQKKRNNPSKYSTSKVVQELKKDEELWPLLQEYVKYDTLIYERALQLHKQQYEAMIALQQQRTIPQIDG
ncbi:unknown protein [Seminavis robusta]|uniref:Uncharacterized protein n=1 Tax=Seminavis robusta TaxID=568900 RepID=A0A9N8EUY6_9STRA|nr:unknown protein [Seminavis robusta]|eukprot:Sro2053_g312640.1 n/a (469) ;mRNA; f:860-2266